MTRSKRAAVISAIVLLGAWFYANFDHVFAGDDDSVIRLVLGVLFTVLLLLRRKPSDGAPRLPRWLAAASAVAGLVLAVPGILAPFHLFQWLGVLLLVLACLLWVAPPHWDKDLCLAFLVLFWVHPLPGQVFDWLQSGMQTLTVQIAEYVLQAANVRVWADGIELRTGYQTFMVPEACSGMRAAVTAFLSCLGVCLLLRMRWYEAIAWECIGMSQVLLLNAARVTYMVLWAPRMDPGWADTFLHDTLSTFLLGSVLLIQLEAGFWKAWVDKRRRIRAGIRRGELEGPDRASIVPGAIRRLAVFGGIALLIVGFFGGIGVAIYRGRPSHRAEMLRGVVTGLMDTNPDVARRAIAEGLHLLPGDRDFLIAQARTSLLTGDVEDGLRQLNDLEAEAPLVLQEQVLKSWALMRLGRRAEARALADTFPPWAGQLPGVAMLRAEFAAAERHPEDAARNTVVAARSHLMLPRVRALFPYLAMHEQWETIVRADRDAPYVEVSHGLIAVHAALRIGESAQAATALKRALKSWPGDARFLPSIYALAQKWHGGEWEDAFAAMLQDVLGSLNGDGLGLYLEKTFRLRRPDLAWLLMSRLEALAPDDPSLHLMPARFCTDWYVVRKHRIGLAADHPEERIGLAAFAWQTSGIEPFRSLWRRVPRGAEMAGLTLPDEFRQRELDLCLAELKRREAAGIMNQRMELMYPTALALAGKHDEAHARLDMIEQRHPILKEEVLFQHAVLYDQQGDWPRSYEALRTYQEEDGLPNLTADLMRINAFMNMNMGVCAMEAIRQSRAGFPGAVRLDLAEAAIWDVFGYKEQALHILDRTAIGRDTAVAVDLLKETGRLNEAKRLAEALGVAFDMRNVKQNDVRMMPAEWSVKARWPAPPAGEALAATIEDLKKQAAAQESPFVKALRELQVRWHERGPDASLLAVDAWTAPARDRLERLAALHACGLLSAIAGQRETAVAAVRRALSEAPLAPVLWRMLVGLTDGAGDVVREAHAACPDDSELWLAALVIGVTTNAEPAARAVLLDEAVAAAGRYPPGDVVRGADYLLRQGYREQAVAMARTVIPRARGLLAAYVLGIRAAVAGGDLSWAMTCVINGIENAVDPTPFYRVLVAIKATGGKVDNDLVSALEFLRDRDRQGSQWSEMLGRVYFAKGDMQRALTIFGSVIDEDTRGVRVQTLLLAAEAARLQNKSERALRILESAYALHPERMSILNNLVYMLAQDERTIRRAVELLPKLLDLGGESFAVMDTAAVVYLRSGQLDLARQYLDRAMKGLSDKAYSAAEVKLNAAELRLRMGQHDDARKELDALRRDPGRSDFVDMRARRLIGELDSLQRGARP